jgi:hypothetical protein
LVTIFPSSDQTRTFHVLTGGIIFLSILSVDARP